MITGWKTVPINPTLAMLAEGERAMHELGWERFTERVWQRMLSAVEEPQAEIVVWRGINPRTGEVELCDFRPAPSVIRDFNMRPLYLRPDPEVQRLRDALTLALDAAIDAARAAQGERG